MNINNTTILSKSNLYKKKSRLSYRKLILRAIITLLICGTLPFSFNFLPGTEDNPILFYFFNRTIWVFLSGIMFV